MFAEMDWSEVTITSSGSYCTLLLSLQYTTNIFIQAFRQTQRFIETVPLFVKRRREIYDDVFFNDCPADIAERGGCQKTVSSNQIIYRLIVKAGNSLLLARFINGYVIFLLI